MSTAYFATGLKTAGDTLQKQAAFPTPGQIWQGIRGVEVPLLGRVGGVKTPWKGMAAGGLAGVGHGINDVLQLGTKSADEIAKIKMLADKAKATGGILSPELSLAKRQQEMLEQMNARGLRGKDGKLAPLSMANGMDWLKAVGPHVARRAASWAGAGGMADLGIQAAGNIRKNEMLAKGISYGVPAAAGLGAYGLLKD
jgi:hypothetical protein